MQNSGCTRQIREVFTRIELLSRRGRIDAELSTSQTSLLGTLTDNGPMRMSELARREHVRVPTVSNAVSVLEDLGLVVREPATDDRRAVIVGVTAAGQEAVRRSTERRDARLAASLAALPGEDRDRLERALPTLAELLVQLEREPGVQASA